MAFVSGTAVNSKCFSKLPTPAWRWSQCHFPIGWLTDCLQTIQSINIKKANSNSLPPFNFSTARVFLKRRFLSLLCSGPLPWPGLPHLCLFFQGQMSDIFCIVPWSVPAGAAQAPSVLCSPPTATKNPGACCSAFSTSTTHVPVLHLT